MTYLFRSTTWKRLRKIRFDMKLSVPFPLRSWTWGDEAKKIELMFANAFLCFAFTLPGSSNNNFLLRFCSQPIWQLLTVSVDGNKKCKHCRKVKKHSLNLSAAFHFAPFFLSDGTKRIARRNQTKARFGWKNTKGKYLSRLGTSRAHRNFLFPFSILSCFYLLNENIFSQSPGIIKLLPSPKCFLSYRLALAHKAALESIFLKVAINVRYCKAICALLVMGEGKAKGKRNISVAHQSISRSFWIFNLLPRICDFPNKTIFLKENSFLVAGSETGRWSQFDVGWPGNTRTLKLVPGVGNFFKKNPQAFCCSPSHSPTLWSAFLKPKSRDE